MSDENKVAKIIFFSFFFRNGSATSETPLMTKRQHSTAQRPTPECAGGRTHKKGRKNDNDALLARLQLNGWMTVTVLRSVGANAGRQDWYFLPPDGSKPKSQGGLERVFVVEPNLPRS